MRGRRFLQPGAAQTGLPVDIGSVLHLGIKGAVRTLIDGIAGADQVADIAGIGVGVLQPDIAGNGGNTHHLQLRLAMQHQKGYGVIHADIGIEPNRNFIHTAASHPSYRRTASTSRSTKPSRSTPVRQRALGIDSPYPRLSQMVAPRQYSPAVST